MINLTIETFDDIVGDGLHLVDFYSKHCPACRIMLRNLKALEKRIKDDKIQFETVDVDQEEELADRYEIDDLPTMLLFQNGENIATFTGCKSGEVIKKNILECLAERNFK